MSELEGLLQRVNTLERQRNEIVLSRSHWRGRANHLQSRLDYWIDRYNREIRDVCLDTR